MSQLLVITPEKVCLQLPRDSQLYSPDLLHGVSYLLIAQVGTRYWRTGCQNILSRT